MGGGEFYRRNLADGPISHTERRRNLLQAAPDLTAAQLECLFNGQIESERHERGVEALVYIHALCICHISALGPTDAVTWYHVH